MAQHGLGATTHVVNWEITVCYLEVHLGQLQVLIVIGVKSVLEAVIPQPSNLMASHGVHGHGAVMTMDN
jgi:hypothetical protein